MITGPSTDHPNIGTHPLFGPKMLECENVVAVCQQVTEKPLPMEQPRIALDAIADDIHIQLSGRGYRDVHQTSPLIGSFEALLQQTTILNACQKLRSTIITHMSSRCTYSENICQTGRLGVPDRFMYSSVYFA